jgi:hypothetical protein
LSADMFQFLTNGRSVARELLRVTRGPILLSHFYPPEGRSGSGSSGLDGPSALEIFAERGPRLHDEEAILDVFLSRRELDLSLAPPERNEVLVLTSGVEPRKYPGADYFVAGSVLNPIYDVREEGEQLHLQRRFLSEKYTERLRRYDPLLPERLTVTREQIAARDPELVRRFVLLDLPPNYC